MIVRDKNNSLGLLFAWQGNDSAQGAARINLGGFYFRFAGVFESGAFREPSCCPGNWLYHLWCHSLDFFQVLEIQPAMIAGGKVVSFGAR